MSGTEIASTNPVDRKMYANWYEWAYRSVSKDQNKAHAAAWAAAVAGAGGVDSAGMETAARLAAKDKQIVKSAGSDVATRTYAEWFLYAVTRLGVTGDTAHLAAAAAQAGRNSDDAAYAAEQAAGVHGEFSRARLIRTQRWEAFARAERECPFPITKEAVNLPGGLQLMNDEFLVASGRDWGFSSQQILITTHRAIWTHGRFIEKQQNAIYLTDIRDVLFKKPLVGYGSLAFETSSGHVIEALPNVSNGTQVRNSLLTLIHFARNRSQQPQAVARPQQPAVLTPGPDRYEQLKKLADLKAQGILSEEEFQIEKAKILST